MGMLKTCPYLFAKPDQPNPFKNYLHDLRGLIIRVIKKIVELARADRSIITKIE